MWNGVTLDNLKKLIGKHVAAILVEPVQGEGGARKAPEGYLKITERYSIRKWIFANIR